MPERIRRQRTRGWRLPQGAVIVDRTSRWGNPYRVGDEGVPDRATAVALFREFLTLRAISPGLPSIELAPGTGIPVYPDVEEIRQALAGKDLACWCPLPEPDEPDVCHGAVLLAFAAPVDDWCEDCFEPLCVCMAMFGPAIVDVPTRGLL